MIGIAGLFTQTVSVRTKTSGGTYGAGYSDPVTVRCFINDHRQAVRASDGSETISETTLYAPLNTGGTFAIGSRVTVNGRESEVLGVFRRDSAGPSSTHHMQITLK